MGMFTTRTISDRVRVEIDSDDNNRTFFETDAATARRMAEELTNAADHLDKRNERIR